MTDVYRVTWTLNRGNEQTSTELADLETVRRFVEDKARGGCTNIRVWRVHLQHEARGGDGVNDYGNDDAINHPAHYGGRDNPYEVIKVTDAWLTPEENIGAMKFLVIKYVARAGKKDSSTLIEDLKKARWYLDHLITRLRP